MSLVMTQPADVDAVFGGAVEAGATVLKKVAGSLWGYGGVVRAPDGTIWTVATSGKKNSRPAARELGTIVLQLGVADVNASKRFYGERGMKQTRSFGSRYAEFESGAIKLTLNKRAGLAKTAGVPADGTGSHRLLIGGGTAAFIDLDGYAWVAEHEGGEGSLNFAR